MPIIDKTTFFSIPCLTDSWEDFQIVFHLCCFVFLTHISVACISRCLSKAPCDFQNNNFDFLFNRK